MSRPARRTSRGEAAGDGSPAHGAEDAAAFRAAVSDVRPLRAARRIEPFRPPRVPVARQRALDERAVLEELAGVAAPGSGAPRYEADDLEAEEDRSYLRAGLPRDILRKLRRGHWRVQDEADLHGLNADEAAEAAVAFLASCRRRGLRCLRIIHGKGLRSHRREPVLKHRIRKLLQRRSEVLAYVEPRAIDGGGGAVLVLLSG